MKSVAEDKLPLTSQFVDEMYFCLDCQACETICPAGVDYGSLVEDARRLIAEQKKDPLPLWFLKRSFLSVLTSPRRLKWFARFAHWYERSGLREAVDRSEILSVFSPRLHEKHAMLPYISEKPFDAGIGEVILPADGEPRGRVGFLSGCVMNIAFSDVHHDAVRLLTALGYAVVIPRGQGCCGSLHGHVGEVGAAKVMARRNLDAFGRYNVDAVVVDSAGCSAFMKDYGSLLTYDFVYAESASGFSALVKDITEFLAERELPRFSTLKKRVTYHEACHLVHTQKVSLEPRKLISAIPGVEFVELAEAAWCCGSAGIYNIHRFDDSMKMLERKIHNIAATGAEVVVTANPGCHLQLQYGVRKFGLKMEVIHPVSLLARGLG